MIMPAIAHYKIDALFKDQIFFPDKIRPTFYFGSYKANKANSHAPIKPIVIIDSDNLPC